MYAESQNSSIARLQVFEIFGPVKKPYYSVRVNSQDHAHTLGLSPGSVLYVVPASVELTHYVFTRELVKLVFLLYNCMNSNNGYAPHMVLHVPSACYVCSIYCSVCILRSLLQWVVTASRATVVFVSILQWVVTASTVVFVY